MKIAICNVQEFNPTIGGIERVSVSLATQLIACGVSIIFVSCRRSPYSEDYTLPAPQFFLPNDADYAEENITALTDILKKEQVDIILNQNAHSQLFNKFCAKVKQKSGLPLISVLHFCPDMRIRANRNRMDFKFFNWKQLSVIALRDIATRWPFRFFTMYPHRKLYKHLYEISDRTVLLSEKYFHSFMHIAGVEDSTRLCAINNMLSFPYKRQENFQEKKKQILFCGRFSPQKNPYRALYVWKQLQEELTDWEFVLIGDGPFKKRLKELSSELGLQRTRFLGFQNPVSYYKESSLMLLTSNYEGWGLVLTEAMQHGCVPIAFNSFDSITDVIEHKKNGLLIPPFDVDKMAQEILSLIRKNEIPQYADEANKKVEKFTPENIGTEWLELFQEVLYRD